MAGAADDEEAADDLSDSPWDQVAQSQGTWSNAGDDADESWPRDRTRGSDDLAAPGHTTRLVQTVELEAAPEDVYDAYMDAERHGEFTGKSADVERCVGGQMHAHGGYISGSFLELEDGYRIVQTWRTNMWPEGYPDSQLTLTFEPTDEGHTRLTMEHDQVPTEQASAYGEGWEEYYWEPLRRYFAC